MAKDSKKQSLGPEGPSGLCRMLDGHASLVEKLYAESQASRWELTFERFSLSVERSASRRFAGESPARQKLADYLAGLHAEDLALATACAAGCESAWEHFFSTYRQYLYSAAAAITRRPPWDPYACEFADSLYATLYGRETTLGRVSLFNHFHGRSKLSTWLRAVLAQRYIDVLRQEKRLEGVEDDEAFEKILPPRHKTEWEPPDPRRARYLRLLAAALRQAIASLDPLDRTRLISYYLKDLTLAEIAKGMNEHEATVSRKLERIRREVKDKVITALKSGYAANHDPHARSAAPGQPGLDDAQIQLCFAYATEAWPFDFSLLLEAIPSQPGLAKSPPPDG